MIRADFVFSYWIFAWYIAYITKLTTYNPKFGLALGIVENIIMAIALVVYGAKVMDVAKFLLINAVMKGIPLYSIYDTKHQLRDIYAIGVLFMIYLLWIHINGETVLEYNKKIFNSILHGKNETPLMWLINKFGSFYPNSLRITA